MVTFLKVVQAHVWMGSWHLAYPMISGPVKLNFTVNPGLHAANHTVDLTLIPGLTWYSDFGSYSSVQEEITMFTQFPFDVWMPVWKVKITVCQRQSTYLLKMLIQDENKTQHWQQEWKRDVSYLQSYYIFLGYPL